jgi:uncharacterized repeat protein (TIGR02543 family)
MINQRLIPIVSIFVCALFFACNTGATIKEPTYSLAYDGNGNTGGAVPVDSTSYKSGSVATVLGNSGSLSKTGFAFSGWNGKADGSGTSYAAGASLTIGSANVTLYAAWTKTADVLYSVTYNGNGNTGGAVPVDSISYKSGSVATVLGNSGSLSKTGFTFSGWNGKADGSGTSYAAGASLTIGSANVTLYAAWAASSPSAVKIIDHMNYDPSALSDAEIAKAATLDVYFEHASVGGNIVDGIDALAKATPRYSSGRTSGAPDPAWWATHNGLGDYQRGNPGNTAKISQFTTDMTAAMGAAVNVAMYKFCFIDSPSSASDLFATAKAAMESLEVKYPSMTFVWWTMPITTASYTGDTVAQRPDRQSYNELVRSYCKANDKWLIDIADIESHDDSGVAITNGSGLELLYSSYSSDGGHLNEAGEKKIALAYWKLIGEIGKTK